MSRPIANHIQKGLVGLRGEREVDILGPWTPPIVGDASSGALRLEIAPHLRDSFTWRNGKHLGLAGKADLDEYGRGIGDGLSKGKKLIE